MHFSKNKIKELELLCSLKEVPLDFRDLENVVLSLRQVVNISSQSSKQIALWHLFLCSKILFLEPLERSSFKT